MRILVKLSAVGIVLCYVTLMSWMAIFEFGPIPYGFWIFIGIMAIITTLYTLLTKDYYN